MMTYVDDLFIGGEDLGCSSSSLSTKGDLEDFTTGGDRGDTHKVPWYGRQESVERG